jgi:hypothetical protein
MTGGLKPTHEQLLVLDLLSAAAAVGAQRYPGYLSMALNVLNFLRDGQLAMAREEIERYEKRKAKDA